MTRVARDPLFICLVFGMVVFVAECFEGDEAIEHGREDGSETVGALAAFGHPFLGFAQGMFTEGVYVVAGEPLCQLVEFV